MRAKCNKVLKNYTEAEKEYLSLTKQYKREEGKRIARYIFGMILMPLEINRKVIYAVLFKLENSGIYRGLSRHSRSVRSSEIKNLASLTLSRSLGQELVYRRK